MIRAQRYGYGDANPYQVVWWMEDVYLSGHYVREGDQERELWSTRRSWTTQGCQTIWSK